MQRRRSVYAVAGGLGLLGALSVVTVSQAGSKVTQAVSVNTQDRYASGSLASARASGDTNQLIGCLIQSTGVTVCQATNSARTMATCSSSDAGIRAAAQSVNGDSRILFYYNSSGTCTSLSVENYSYWAPKVQ